MLEVEGIVSGQIAQLIEYLSGPLPEVIGRSTQVSSSYPTGVVALKKHVILTTRATCR
jgi:hypothetical protein